MNAHRDAQEEQGLASPAGVASVPTVDTAAVLKKHEPTFPSWADRSACMECRGRWRGDGESGGCDAVLLARRVIALEALLPDLLKAMGTLAVWSPADSPSARLRDRLAVLVHGEGGGV